MIDINQARLPEDLRCVQDLLRQYLDWVGNQLRKVNNEVVDIDTMMHRSMSELDAYMPLEGRLLLAQYHSSSAGIVFMKKSRHDSCEIKRMYVVPEFRGCGIGQALLDHVIEDARIEGYSYILLDTVEFMQQAQSLYRSRGFKQIDPYPESEMRDSLSKYLIYMSLDLGN
jgi:ribosomal protein S18 acetylase RimI-like enzyme